MRVLLLFLIAVGAPAQDLTAQIDPYFGAYLNQKRFSGSILVARDGKVLASKGYGMANLEHRAPNTPKTKYRLGSITKQFAAMAILQQEERGRLKVEDPICKFLPECPAAWQPLTIHHLLTHTSRIPNMTSFPEYRKEWMLPSRPPRTMLKFRDKPLEFEPGSRFRYSNSGYVLLAMILEKASGESWENYLRKNIFDPLGMSDSGHDTHEAILADRATGYWLENGQWANSAYHDMSIPIGGGDLYSTVEDMYKWDQALYTEKLVSKRTLEKQFTPFKDGYAYGWMVGRQFNRARIFHGGGINGFTTQIHRYPDDRAVVIVLSNFMSSPTGPIARDLAAMMFGEKYEIPGERKEVQVDPGILGACVGKYEMRPGLILTVTREGDRLMAQLTGQPKFEIFPESETKFFLKVVEAQITFHREPDGKVDRLTLHQGGSDVPARRTE